MPKGIGKVVDPVNTGIPAPAQNGARAPRRRATVEAARPKDDDTHEGANAYSMGVCYFGTSTGPCLMESRTERIVVGSALHSRRQT
jgi:hypothetical protein